MSDETTLRECPFCGGEYTQVRWIGSKDNINGAFESGFRGECTECFALTRAFNTKSEAIAAWNARAERAFEVEYDRLKAKVAELTEKLDGFEGETYCGGTVVDWHEMAVRLQAQVDEMHETHMRLPVDADGVPIMPGDVLESTIPEIPEPFTAYFVGRYGEILDDETSFHHANRCCHVKPDTVEDVIMEAMQHAFSAPYQCRTLDMGDKVAEYAERIRKAVEQ